MAMTLEQQRDKTRAYDLMERAGGLEDAADRRVLNDEKRDMAGKLLRESNLILGEAGLIKGGYTEGKGLVNG